MSREERAALSRCLAAVNAERPSSAAADRRRRLFVILLTCVSLGFIPWIVVLALTLPHHYLAGHWTLTWVGFDVVLLGCLASTAWLAWRRRQAVVIAAFITATLLACDAWFDITTSSGRTDTIVAIASALLLELPLATFLFVVAHHLLHLVVRRAQAAQGVVDAPSTLVKLPLLGMPQRQAEQAGAADPR